MKVFILAGGLGTRIRALFPDRPKSMIPFKGKPFIEYQMDMLAQQGFEDFVLCLGYRAQAIRDYFEDGTRWPWTITYSQETSPLGTAGALRYAEAHFEQAILLLNGDTYMDTDYQAIVTYHRQHPNAVGTLAVTKVEDTARYGQVMLDADQQIIAFREKAVTQGPGHVNAGVYVLKPNILHAIPAGEKVSLERDVFPALLAADKALYGCPVPDAFIDIGTPQGYQIFADCV